MNWYGLVKLLHIIATIVCVGGLFARQLIRRQSMKADDIRTFAIYNKAAGAIEQIMVIPGTTAILVFGIILAILGGFPMLGFLQGASQNWLLASNILLVGMVVIIPAVFIPRGKIFASTLYTALEQGQITPELRASMNDRAVKIAHLYEEVAITVIIALMVLKPF